MDEEDVGDLYTCIYIYAYMPYRYVYVYICISHSNTHIWNLEKWYWRIYLQGILTHIYVYITYVYDVYIHMYGVCIYATYIYIYTHNGMLLLLLSRFNYVRLCVTPQTAAHQVPPSLGFSRQEQWSGLPFPSPMQESEKWKWSRSVVSNSQRPHGQQHARLLRPRDFPGKNTDVGCHCLLCMLLDYKNNKVLPFIIRKDLKSIVGLEPHRG